MTSLSNEEALKLLAKEQSLLTKHLSQDIFVDAVKATTFERFTTGQTVIDRIMGGGIPRGLLGEISGPESTGKSSWLGGMIAANQKLDPNFRVLYLDFEQTVDLLYFRDGLGVNIDKPNFILSQPLAIEEGTMICRRLMTLGLVDLIIWDTPAASRPIKELTVDMGEKDIRDLAKAMKEGKSTQEIGLHARVFSHAIQEMVGLASKTKTAMIFPNQIRTTINTWGAGETTPGGRALKFYCSWRIRISRKEAVKDSVQDDYFGTKVATDTGNLVQFRTVKNKTAPPQRIAEAKLRFGQGFLDIETVFDLAVKRKVIEKAGGGNYTLPDGWKGRGTELALEHLRLNPEAFNRVKNELNGLSPEDDGYEPLPENVEADEGIEPTSPDEPEPVVQGLAPTASAAAQFTEADSADLPEGATTF